MEIFNSYSGSIILNEKKKSEPTPVQSFDSKTGLSFKKEDVILTEEQKSEQIAKTIQVQLDKFRETITDMIKKQEESKTINKTIVVETPIPPQQDLVLTKQNLPKAVVASDFFANATNVQMVQAIIIVGIVGILTIVIYLIVKLVIKSNKRQIVSKGE